MIDALRSCSTRWGIFFLNIWCLGSDWEDDIASGYDVCARLCHVTPFNYISYAYIYYL